MIDLAERAKLEVDAERLGRALGVAVVPVTATQRRGLDELARAVLDAADQRARRREVASVAAAEEEVRRALRGDGAASREAGAARPLLGRACPRTRSGARPSSEARARLSSADPHWWQEPLLARYRLDRARPREGAVRGGRAASAPARPSASTASSRTRFFGPFVLLLVMLIVFQAIFSWATLPMDLIDRGFGALGEALRAQMPAGLLTDLLVDGVIAGVGGVLVFLPQILLLFFFIALLEDSGYMSRAAFLMDRLMRGVGLHGKAFMPLLSSFACAIPGIMATRTIENPKDRLATIMIAPFMRCSARLPVYTLMIAAFFSDAKVFGFVSVGALLILAMYLLGIAVAIVRRVDLEAHDLEVAAAAARAGAAALPRAELPEHRCRRCASRAWLFVKRAGTVILAISILLWALMTFPRSPEKPVPDAEEGAAVQAMRETGAESRGEPAPVTAKNGRETADEGEQLRQSYAGRLGHVIEPVIAPLGFDWKMGIGLIASFAAREMLVSTLSIVYNVGKDADDRVAFAHRGRAQREAAGRHARRGRRSSPSR